MPSSAIAAPVAGSVISGVLGSKANKKAAQSSEAGKAEQLALANNQIAKNTAAFAPYTTAGSASQNLLNNYLGIDTGQNANVTNAQAEFDSANNAYNTAVNSQTNHNLLTPSLGNSLSSNFMGNLGNNPSANNNAFNPVNLTPFQQRLDAARTGLSNARNTPTTHDSNFGSLLHNFSNEDFVKDPGYQFRLDEGTKGLENASLARGGFDSGAQLKALARYNQDYASSEFGNASNRDSANKTRTYDFLTGNANRGANAVASNASSSAGLISGAGTAIGNNATNQGNYAVNGASAINNAVQGGIGNYLYQNRVNAPNASVVGAGVPSNFQSSSFWGGK